MALQPNAPPTNCVTTEILDSGRPSSTETVSWTALMPWHESHSVSWSPSQAAVVFETSMGLWWLAANVNGASTRIAASASPSSTCPRSSRPGMSPPKILSGI
jgi:hypothetical protein